MKRLLAILIAIAPLALVKGAEIPRITPLTPVKGAEIPRKSPDFQISMPGGKQISLAQFKGKPVVLEFLLTTCPHCQYTSTIVEKLYKEYRAQGLVALGAAINTGADKLVPAFVRDQQLTYPVGFVQDAKALSYLQHPPALIPYMPQMVFIDRQGTIRAQYSGDNAKFFDRGVQENNIREEILKLLNPVEAARKGTKQ